MEAIAQNTRALVGIQSPLQKIYGVISISGQYASLWKMQDQFESDITPMKDINNISIDELKEIIYSSNTKTDILKYFGINKLNNIGHKLLKKIENITSINIDELYKIRKYNNISEYYKNPKICKYCNSVIKYDNRKQDFCDKKCSILYLNNKKKKHNLFGDLDLEHPNLRDYNNQSIQLCNYKFHQRLSFPQE